MKKTAIKLTVLSIILLVSISIVLGATYNTTYVPSVTSTPIVPVRINTTNVTGMSTVANTTNATVTETVVQDTTVPTPEKTVATVEQTYPTETSTPQKPIQTPKSPGFGSLLSVAVLLLTMYIVKRK